MGAGYIAVELAGVLNELGADTTLFFRGDSVLRSFDDLIRGNLMTEMARNGMKLQGKSTPKVRQGGRRGRGRLLCWIV